MKAAKYCQLLFLCLGAAVKAQQWPAEGAVLNHNEVWLEGAFVKGASSYQFTIWKEGARDNRPVYSYTGSLPAVRTGTLEWGTRYHWVIEALGKKRQVLSEEHYSFALIPRINSSTFYDHALRVRINEHTLHNGGLIAVDYMKTLFRRDGSAAWVIPPLPGINDPTTEIRDIKLSPANTITFLSDNHPVEMDLNGRVLWRAPEPFVYDNDTLLFHHDFKRTPHNTYLLLANRKVFRRITVPYEPGQHPMVREYFEKDGQLYARTEVAVVIETDLKGNILWHWDANEYLKDEDLNFKKGRDGFPQLATHSNALCIDDSNVTVFLGFRDLGRIIAIDKRTKKVKYSFGQVYPSGEARFARGLFRQQHDCRPTANKSILVFNNNGPRGNFGVAGILELKTDPQPGDSVLLWKFDLDFDTLTKGRVGSGGSVQELPNGNILFCGGQMNRIFEVNRQKEVLWDAFSYAIPAGDSTWHNMPGYRSSWLPAVYPGRVLSEDAVFFPGKYKKAYLSVKVYNPGKIQDEVLLRLVDSLGTLVGSSVCNLKPGGSSQCTVNLPSGTTNISGLTLILSSVRLPGSVRVQEF